MNLSLPTKETALSGFALIVRLALGAMFTVVLASALYRRLDISCGCFSSAVVITLLSAAAYAATILLAPKQWLPSATTPEPKPQGTTYPEPAPTQSLPST